MFQFSFLLPTRGHPELVNRFFQSVGDTTSCIDNIEIILCLDSDDSVSRNITNDQLFIKKVILPKGSTMGSLNRASFDASSGRYLVIMNDDVIIRTKNWDKILAAVFSAFQDDIALIHVNDLLFRDKFCTFPILSRKACLEIGICPPEYMKYRIDDHIYDIYNILAYLGYRRIIYLPEVVFEHDNRVRTRRSAKNQIFEFDKGEVRISNKEIIESDLYIFNEKLDERKQNALKLARLIDGRRYEERKSAYVELLNEIKDPYSYRRADFVKKIDSRQYSSLFNLREDQIMERYNGELVGTLGSAEYPMYNRLLVKLFSLIKLNRHMLRFALTIITVIKGAFNRYYFRLPVFIRRVTDGLVSKLVKIYRVIQYDALSSEK